MKKVLSILVLIIMIMGVVTAVYATSSSELADKLYEMGKPYGMRNANKVRIERYLKDACPEIKEVVQDNAVNYGEGFEF